MTFLGKIPDETSFLALGYLVNELGFGISRQDELISLCCIVEFIGKIGAIENKDRPIVIYTKPSPIISYPIAT